jgi:predicted lactoylglutathione lyase
MLLVENRFQEFTPKRICDTTTHIEAMLGLSADSRDEVDEIVDKALAAGAEPAGETQDLGVMDGRSFQDPDGHVWEYSWMDPSALQGEPVPVTA